MANPEPNRRADPMLWYRTQILVVCAFIFLAAFMLVSSLVQLNHVFTQETVCLPGRICRTLALSDSGATIISGGIENNSGFIAASKDTGASWEETALPLDCKQITQLDVDWKTGQGICVGGDPHHAFFYSTDTGITWQAAQTNIIYSDTSTTYYVTQFTYDFKIGRGYAVDNEGQLLETYNAGHNWNVSEAPAKFLLTNDYTRIKCVSFDWKSGYGMMTIEPFDRDGELQNLERNDKFIAITLDTGKTWAKYSTNFAAFSQLWIRYDNTYLISSLGLTRKDNLASMLRGSSVYKNADLGSLTYHDTIYSSAKDFTRLDVDWNSGSAVAGGITGEAPRKGIVADLNFRDTTLAIRETLLDTADIITAVHLNRASRKSIAATAKGNLWIRQSTNGPWKKLVPGSEIPDSSRDQFIIYMCIISIVAGGFILVIALYTYRRKLGKVNTSNPTELSLSIKPDSPTDTDGLGFDPTTEALTKTICNPDLSLPLSVVINGDWGSGKTSFMLQVKKRLEQHAGQGRTFVTSWFNIWHFENEAEIFNAFIGTITASLEKKAGIWFRFRIFLSKLGKLKWYEQIRFGFSIGIIFSVIVAILVFLGAYSLNLLSEKFHWGIDAKGIKPNLEWLKETDLTGWIFGGGVLGSIVLGLLNIGEQYTKSGFSALRELIPLKKLQLSEGKAEPGARAQFRSDFREIMKAVREENMTLVVFIDDLDRASGDHIMNILATMNFISDTAANAGANPSDQLRADIVFIMGMAADIVIENMNKNMFGENGTVIPGQSAENYLEKMVDIVIHVPVPEKDKLNSLTSTK